MRFAENNRISHKQLYRQMILEFLAPFILCMYGAGNLNGINALIGMAMALIPLGFYVIVLIRMTPVFENLKKSGGVLVGRLTGLFFHSVCSYGRRLYPGCSGTAGAGKPDYRNV